MHIQVTKEAISNAYEAIYRHHTVIKDVESDLIEHLTKHDQTSLLGANEDNDVHPAISNLRHVQSILSSSDTKTPVTLSIDEAHDYIVKPQSTQVHQWLDSALEDARALLKCDFDFEQTDDLNVSSKSSGLSM